MAFYPVYSAASDAGEYGKTLFTVVGASLMLSWLISITITPMQCISLLRTQSGASEDPYGSQIFVAFQNVLHRLIRFRVLTISAATAMLLVAIWGFGSIPQQFFPDSTRAQFLIDYWAPEGTPISKVSNDLKAIEEKLISDPRTADIGTFIGAGGPRFYLPVDPEFPYQSYGQIVVNTPSFAEVDPLVEMMEPWLLEHVTQALTRVRKYTVGPGDTWPFEMRIVGGADADPATLRRLGEEAMEILRNSGMAKHVRLDMRQPVQKIVIDYSQERARWAAVSRLDIARATSRAHDGTPIGIYREGEDTYPIIARAVGRDRSRA
ncbi:MAG: efflux RND transporter permease subunit, partial [Pseudomonadales bacterium]